LAGNHRMLIAVAAPLVEHPGTLQAILLVRPDAKLNILLVDLCGVIALMGMLTLLDRSLVFRSGRRAGGYLRMRVVD